MKKKIIKARDVMHEKLLELDGMSTVSQALAAMVREEDDPGITWNERSRARDPQRMSPRQAR